MRLFLSIIVYCIVFCMAYAQEETLITGEVEHGGFGGPVVKFTQIKDEFAVLVGGYGGWIVNHTFILGGGGYGLANEIDPPAELALTDQRINFGYGGVYIAYVHNSDKLVHFTVHILIGGGGAGYGDIDYQDSNNTDEQFNDAIFVTEPGIDLIANITDFFRIGVGASYRYVSGINKLQGVDNLDFSGPAISLVFKFGRF